MSDSIHEECGVFGIWNSNPETTARLTYYGLYALQHRGQESCGIAVTNEKGILLHKDLGLVSEVFDDDRLSRLTGKIAIGHVRYSTTGSNTRENAQPLCARYAKGTLSVAHNGNIANSLELRTALEYEGALFQSTNDTEVIAFMIARERVRCGSVEEAVKRVMPKLRGSYSMVIMSPHKLIAVRDPWGIRPLCIGRIDSGDEQAVVFASESCALDSVHARFVRNVKPGEIVIADNASGEIRSIETVQGCGKCDSAFCIFEHIYFARPDSVIDGQSVYEARILAGRCLAKSDPVDADMIIGVPDSGSIAAMGYSLESGIPYGIGLVKNRYIGRTFIQPSQTMREMSVSIKLNVLAQNVKGKRIVMVDDSIVRGTTIANIVKLLKDAGASEVHVRISAPQFLYPCYFGTDVPDRENLACVNFTLEELREKIHADSLSFLRLEDLDAIAPDSTLHFCKGCFTGQYPFEIPKDAGKTVFELPFYFT
ncbi:MAG: amidophosphoribosyltransferase [Clostridia bacterium]|nr:amidophosphoribosyltransferase [Clostridia bacterium]